MRKKKKKKKGTHWKFNSKKHGFAWLFVEVIFVDGWQVQVWNSKIGGFFQPFILGCPPFSVNSHHQKNSFIFRVTGDPNLNPSLFPGRVTNPTFIKLKRPLKLMCFSNVFLVILNEWRWDIHYYLRYLWIPVRQFSNHPPSFTKVSQKKVSVDTCFIEDPWEKEKITFNIHRGSFSKTKYEPVFSTLFSLDIETTGECHYD